MIASKIEKPSKKLIISRLALFRTWSLFDIPPQILYPSRGQRVHSGGAMWGEKSA